MLYEYIQHKELLCDVSFVKLTTDKHVVALFCYIALLKISTLIFFLYKKILRLYQYILKKKCFISKCIDVVDINAL